MTETGQIPAEGLPENAGHGVASGSAQGQEAQQGAHAPGAHPYHLDPSARRTDDDLLLMPSVQGAWSEAQPTTPLADGTHGQPGAQDAFAAGAVQDGHAVHGEPTQQGVSAEYSEAGSQALDGMPGETETVPAAHGEPGAQAASVAQDQPRAHETAGRDSGFLDVSEVRTPAPKAPQPTPARRPLHLGPPVPDSSSSLVRPLSDRGPAESPTRRPQSRPAPPPESAPEPSDEPAAADPHIPAPIDDPTLAGPQLGALPPHDGGPWAPHGRPEDAYQPEGGYANPAEAPAAGAPIDAGVAGDAGHPASPYPVDGTEASSPPAGVVHGVDMAYAQGPGYEGYEEYATGESAVGYAGDGTGYADGAGIGHVADAGQLSVAGHGDGAPYASGLDGGALQDAVRFAPDQAAPQSADEELPLDGVTASYAAAPVGSAYPQDPAGSAYSQDPAGAQEFAHHPQDFSAPGAEAYSADEGAHLSYAMDLAPADAGPAAGQPPTEVLDAGRHADPGEFPDGSGQFPAQPGPDTHQPVGQFVAVEGSVPTTPHLAPTPPHALAIPPSLRDTAHAGRGPSGPALETEAAGAALLPEGSDGEAAEQFTDEQQAEFSGGQQAAFAGANGPGEVQPDSAQEAPLPGSAQAGATGAQNQDAASGGDQGGDLLPDAYVAGDSPDEAGHGPGSVEAVSPGAAAGSGSGPAGDTVGGAGTGPVPGTEGAMGADAPAAATDAAPQDPASGAVPQEYVTDGPLGDTHQGGASEAQARPGPDRPTVPAPRDGEQHLAAQQLGRHHRVRPLGAASASVTPAEGVPAGPEPVQEDQAPQQTSGTAAAEPVQEPDPAVPPAESDAAEPGTAEDTDGVTVEDTDGVTVEDTDGVTVEDTDGVTVEDTDDATAEEGVTGEDAAAQSTAAHELRRKRRVLHQNRTPAQPTPASAAAPAPQQSGSPQAAPGSPGPESPPGTEPAPGRAPASAYGEAEREAVLRVMRERRDIRNGFRSDPIPDEVLLRVLEAAHTAPSVGHSQPWDFVVIRSEDTRRTMHELAMRQRDAYAKSLPKGRAKQFRELKIEAILDTPVNIVVTADPTRGGRHTLGRHTQPQMAPYSSALAVENLWLAARAEGLGVGWVSFFDERETISTLGLPEHLEVVAYLCVGYVDEFPDEPELVQSGWSKRRPLSWVVHEETYGRRVLPGAEPHDLLAETMTGIRPLDAKALGEAWERQKRMTKPSGSLGMLEIISAQLSGLSRMCPPPVPEPAAVAIFAGDHGVHAQGVTPWPQEVTGQMVANFLSGGAVCNAFAAQVGAEVCVIDVGVAADLPATPGLLPRKVRAGTADMTTGPALTREEVKAAIEVGIETARDLVAAGNKALLTGEMGVANTTVSAALVAVFTGADPAEVTGRGTGVSDQTLALKTEVVRRALDLHQPDPADPIGVLAAVGGLEHAAIAGLLLGGASLRTPVVLDGVSAGAAALVAHAIAPEVLAACIAGHRSAEPGHVVALNKLGLRPLIDLDLRLGEGTGALLALPLIQSAARAMHEVATFDSAGVTEK
jgi:nicotinate-nucleotide--dimethylbenzimidazole phosphoribosyltransferase